MPVPITFLNIPTSEHETFANTFSEHETLANKLISPYCGDPISNKDSMIEAMIQAQAERDIDDILDAEFMGTTTTATIPVTSEPFSSDHYHTELSLNRIGPDHYDEHSTVNMHVYSSNPSSLVSEMPSLPNMSLSCDSVYPRPPGRSNENYHILQLDQNKMESTQNQREEVKTARMETMTSDSSFLEEKFEEKIKALREFREKYGHVNVPSKPYLYPENPSLVFWCKNIRNGYKLWVKGEKNQCGLTDERVQCLEELGFKWNLKDHRKNERFERKFQKLLEFKTKHGHLELSQIKMEDKALHEWCGLLRRDYKNWAVKNVPLPGRFGLTEEYVQRLQEIGFNFDVQKRTTFEERLEELREFKRKYGHVRLTDNISSKEYRSLGIWCTSMRHAYIAWKHKLPKRTRGLNEERVKALEDMGFQFRLRNIGRRAKARKENDSRF
jgi:hypothetical protein